MSITVVTPSHAPDYPSFVRLHRSVLAHSDDDVRHLVAVPDADVDLFSNIESTRLDVVGYRDVLPEWFTSTTWLARLPLLPRGYRIAAVNRHQLWPPIRGWVLQQIVKLAVVAELEADVALLIDSDVLVVRHLDESVFRRGDAVRLYRHPGGITDEMTRHRRWQATARRLVGSADIDPSSPDYISAFASWSPSLVRACLARVETVTRRPWADAIGAELEFSEYLLVGEYARAFASGGKMAYPAAESLCHSRWEPTPLGADEARAFALSLPPGDVAAHVQSNSGTSEAVLDSLEASLSSPR